MATTVEPLVARLRARLAADGPMAFSAFMEAALYDPEGGFYASGGQAGRRGDFLTSVEVGPLFGAVLARALDTWWTQLGRPDPFVLIDAGAGPGTLARTVARAGAECAPSLVHVMVERSAGQRRAHRDHLPGWVGDIDTGALDALVVRPRQGDGPVAVSTCSLPGRAVDGVVIANELLDNLPFDIVRRSVAGGVEELRVGRDDDGFAPVVVETDPSMTEGTLDGITTGAWVPHQATVSQWVGSARSVLRSGHLVVLDYGIGDADLSNTGDLGWLRTFRGHDRGGHPLDAPGTQDITADIAVDQLRRRQPGAEVTTQAEFLRTHGIDLLVDQGRRVWNERAHLGDLEAIRGRSRVGEAEALLDPAGLGGFCVLHWTIG